MMTAMNLEWQPSMQGIRGSLKMDEPMCRHTSWRLGGRADYYFVPADREDLLEFLSRLPVDLPLMWVGLGSNLLVRDGGLRGVVIATPKGLSDIHRIDDQQVYAEAGVACAQVARFCTRNDLLGAEFLAGIPGSFGGALAMNAGAFGGETWDVIHAVDLVDRTGRVERVSAQRFSPDYREIDLLPGRWFLGAELSLESGDGSVGKSRVQSLLKRRGDSQPVQSANAGSVFRNPDGDFAARLIEAAGLKGHLIGDAEVSTKHANFIINRGQATAADVEQLIDFIQQTVKDRFAVELTPEVRVVGESI